MNASSCMFQRPTECGLSECSTLFMYEQELEKNRVAEARLIRAVAREEALIRQKNELIQQKDVLARESEHRFLNGLQLIASLLRMQGRTTKNAEAADQLALAANRVTTLGRVHRHLHALDHCDIVEFKPYLAELCRDLSEMTSNGKVVRNLTVRGDEVCIPATIAIPLGFIASELVTNSIKYSGGEITVCLKNCSEAGYELSVNDDGPGLPEDFNLSASGGMGMKIVSALARSIDGELRFGSNKGPGLRFAIAFRAPFTSAALKAAADSSDVIITTAPKPTLAIGVGH